MGERGRIGTGGVGAGHHVGEGSSEIVVLEADDGLALANVPEPPPGLTARTKGTWVKFWTSSVSAVVNLESDVEVLNRWILNVDEWHRVIRQIRREGRVVDGSKGQPTAHPLIGYKGNLETAIKDAENQLGLTPAARARLGIKFAEAKKATTASINDDLDQV